MKVEIHEIEERKNQHINELMKNNSVRDIFLYDTFGGLVEPTEHDFTCKDAKIYQMNKDQVYNYWKSHIVNEKINRLEE